jgi:starch phosphorylase
MEQVGERYPGDWERMAKLSIVEEGTPKKIRMANLSIIGSHKINGVAAVHSGLIKTRLFKEFYEMYPSKFCNKTNGVTVRRWVNQANPGLSKLFTEVVGNQDWLTDMSILKAHEHKVVDDPAFHKKWQTMKQVNKKALADMLERELGVKINVNSMFDIQIKRIHEYKR